MLESSSPSSGTQTLIKMKQDTLHSALYNIKLIIFSDKIILNYCEVRRLNKYEKHAIHKCEHHNVKIIWPTKS